MNTGNVSQQQACQWAFVIISAAAQLLMRFLVQMPSSLTWRTMMKMLQILGKKGLKSFINQCQFIALLNFLSTSFYQLIPVCNQEFAYRQGYCNILHGFTANLINNLYETQLRVHDQLPVKIIPHPPVTTVMKFPLQTQCTFNL